MSVGYNLGFGEVIEDPFVVAEFERLAARLRRLERQAKTQGVTRREEQLETEDPSPLDTPDRQVPAEITIPDGTLFTPPPPTEPQDPVWINLDSDDHLTTYFKVTLLVELEFGRLGFIRNISRAPIMLSHTDPLEAATANKPGTFELPLGHPYVLSPQEIALVILDDRVGIRRWRVVGSQPSLFQRQWCAWRPAGSSTTITGIGMPNPSIVIAGVSALQQDSDGNYVRLTSNATQVVVRETVTGVLIGQRPWCEWVVKTGSNLADLRIWIGLSSADNANTDTAAGHFAGFRYSTVIGGGWFGITRDGASQNSIPVASIAANTKYRLRIVLRAANAMYFSVNNGPELKLDTNAPGASTALQPRLSMFCTVGVGPNTIDLGPFRLSYGHL